MWAWHATFRRCTCNFGNVHMKYASDNRQCPIKYWYNTSQIFETNLHSSIQKNCAENLLQPFACSSLKANTHCWLTVKNTKILRVAHTRTRDLNWGIYDNSSVRTAECETKFNFSDKLSKDHSYPVSSQSARPRQSLVRMYYRTWRACGGGGGGGGGTNRRYSSRNTSVTNLHSPLRTLTPPHMASQSKVVHTAGRGTFGGM